MPTRSLLLTFVLVVCGVAAAQAAVAPGDPLPGPHYIVWSQHQTRSEGLVWHAERGPITRAQCQAALKRVLGVTKVGITKWYDVRSSRLHEVFGSVDSPDIATWVACWPEGYRYGEPDE